MKQFILTIGLAIVASVGWGQENETILYFNNFNNTDDNTISGGGYEDFNAGTNTSALENSYDGSQVKHVGNGWVTTDTINSYNLESINISIRVNKLSTQSIVPFIIEYRSLDSSDWVQIYNNPLTSEYYHHVYASIEDVYFSSFLVRFRTNAVWTGLYWNGSHYVDDLIIKGPTPSSPPIIIYETDIPQECMLDGNGDGVISIDDLLNLLQYFGQWSPCDVVNMNPPPNDWEKNLMEQIPTYDPNNKKTLLKIIDASGREVEQNTPGLIFYIYEDGTVEKRMGAR